MRLFDICLFKSIPNGTDKLGNQVNKLTTFNTGEGRKSIWTAQEIALDSRIVSKKLQKIITTIDRKELVTATHLSLKNELFSIEEIKGEDDDRWRIVSAVFYGRE